MNVLGGVGQGGMMGGGHDGAWKSRGVEEHGGA